MFKKILLSTLLILSLAVPSYAVTILPYPKFQAIDTAGNPIVGGLVYTYKAGTTTPKAACATYNCSSYQTNPIVLDSLGEATIYLNGTYKIVLQTSTGTAVWTLDNVRGMGTSDARVDVREFDVVCDGVTDDSAAIQAAIDGVTAGQTLYFPNMSCYLDTGLVWKTGVSAFWDNTTLIGKDAINMIDISNTANWSWMGRLKVQGASPGASNTTYGVYFNASVDRVYIQHLEGEDLPFVMRGSYLTNSKIDTLKGKNIFGQYQTAVEEAGSIIVISDSSDVVVDTVLGYYVGKGAVYLGPIGPDGNNTRLTFGNIQNIVDPTKSYTSTLAIRGCIDCNFGQVNATNGYRAVGIQMEATDTEVFAKIYKINIGQINAKNIQAPDGIAVWISSENPAYYLKQINVGRMNLDTATAHLVGLNRVQDSSFGEIIGKTATQKGLEVLFGSNIHFGHVRMEGVTQQSVYVSASTYIHFNSVEIENGTGTGFDSLNSEFITVDNLSLINLIGFGAVFTSTIRPHIGHAEINGCGQYGIAFYTVTGGSFGSIRGLNVGTALDGTYSVFYADSNSSNIRGNLVQASTISASRHATGASLGGTANIGRISTVISTGHSLVPYIERSQQFTAMIDGKPFITRAAGTPSGGTWETGDTFYFIDPIAAGWIGAVCVTAGPVGSGAAFKGFGALAP
jgi:hypothetical protein